MDKKTIFIVGCKLLSIYCLILGVPLLLTALSTFFGRPNYPEELQTSYFATVTGVRVIPVIILGLSYYLLTQSHNLYEILFKDSHQDEYVLESTSSVVVKSSGIFIIINYIPQFIQSIASFIAIKTSPPVYEMFQQETFKTYNFAGSLFAIALGIYLLIDGRIFIRLGLKK